MKPIIVGQAPGPNTNPDLALFPAPLSSTGGRLWAMTGLTKQEYLRRFRRINLIYDHLGREVNNDKFSRPLGRAAAMAVGQLARLEGAPIVMLGRHVSTSFEYPRAAFFEEHLHCRWNVPFYVVPHPSGRNHWYNNDANRVLARQFWRRLAREVADEDEEEGLTSVAGCSMIESKVDKRPCYLEMETMTDA